MAALRYVPLFNKYLLSIHHSVPRTCAGESDKEAGRVLSVLQEFTNQQERLPTQPLERSFSHLHSDPFYSFTGTWIKGTWYNCPKWLGYGSEEWRGKERSGAHDQQLKMVLLCHL